MLQVRILLFYNESSKDVLYQYVGIGGILISLLFSVLHLWVEVLFIKIESVAFDTSMAYYSIVCFNGRFGWVPHAEKFNSVTC